MKIVTIGFIIVIAVISVIVTFLQHYFYYFYYDYQRKVNSKTYKNAPLFEDMLNPELNKASLQQCHNRGCTDLQKRHFEILCPLDDVIKLSAEARTDRPIIPLQRNKLKFNDNEVYHTLQAALLYKYSGKSEKAIKLFQHAVAMAPDDPDVLNRYGEFIEHTRNDIVAADELYFKALTYSPNHEAALINRKRTADVVDKLDLRLFKNIDEKRNILQTIHNSNEIYESIRKQAYYLHIYHTVGIEGNTMSLEQMRYILETGQAVQGKSIIEHNEVLGLELALQYVKVLTKIPTIEVKHILGIHRRVLGHVDPVNSGMMRQTQVFVGNHVPPPPDDLPTTMESYVEWLNSEEAHSMHPVRYAALAHYKLVDIHPFTDGNGRTSRLIMNLILLRTGYPPVMILKDHRQKYYDYLNAANQGDVRPFVRFIAYCTEHMLDVYLWNYERHTHTIDDFPPRIEMNVNSAEL